MQITNKKIAIGAKSANWLNKISSFPLNETFCGLSGFSRLMPNYAYSALFKNLVLLRFHEKR